MAIFKYFIFRLHLAVLTTFCVLSLISGVYCAVSSGETTVNIVVYVPKSYPYKNTTIISAINKDVKIRDSERMKWFGKWLNIVTNIYMMMKNNEIKQQQLLLLFSHNKKGTVFAI